MYIIRRIEMYADELYNVSSLFSAWPHIVVLTQVIKIDIAFPTDETHPHYSSCHVYIYTIRAVWFRPHVIRSACDVHHNFLLGHPVSVPMSESRQNAYD